MDTCVNRVILAGRIDSPPVYSHSAFGEAFYTAQIKVPRLSVAEDLLPMTISERVLCGETLQEGADIALEGQLRSYNKYVDGASRLILTVFVQRLLSVSEPENMIELTGFLCKPPVYRVTPFSREIADLLVAVNRAYGKSDYIPCIAWGRNARFAKGLSVGTCLSALDTSWEQSHRVLLLFASGTDSL